MQNAIHLKPARRIHSSHKERGNSFNVADSHMDHLGGVRVLDAEGNDVNHQTTVLNNTFHLIGTETKTCALHHVALPGNEPQVAVFIDTHEVPRVHHGLVPDQVLKMFVGRDEFFGARLLETEQMFVRQSKQKRPSDVANAATGHGTWRKRDHLGAFRFQTTSFD